VVVFVKRISTERTSTKVSRAHLEGAKCLFRFFSKGVSEDYILPESAHALGGEKTPSIPTVDLGSRFAAFLSYTRRTPDPAMRIALTCSALESIFSTGSSELTHRVSERVAFMLGDNPSSRKSIYNLVKKLYSIRSAFLHGDSIKKADVPNLIVLTKQADHILRKVANVWCENEQLRKAAMLGQNALDEFHSEILFRGGR
jgi:hypothetical protein